MDHCRGAYSRIRNENSDENSCTYSFKKGQTTRGVNLIAPDRSSFDRNIRNEQSDILLNIAIPILSDLPYYTRSAGTSG